MVLKCRKLRRIEPVTYIGDTRNEYATEEHWEKCWGVTTTKDRKKWGL
jgi:hypothetical protein